MFSTTWLHVAILEMKIKKTDKWSDFVSYFDCVNHNYLYSNAPLYWQSNAAYIAKYTATVVKALRDSFQDK